MGTVHGQVSHLRPRQEQVVACEGKGDDKVDRCQSGYMAR